MLELNGNDDDLQRKLAALERAASDMRPALEVIGRTLITRIRLCFKLGIDPWGTPWAALKIRKGQPLVDTGRLRSSITSQVSDTGLSIGTNLRSKSGARYPAVHQFGAVIEAKPGKRLAFAGPNGTVILAKKVTIPARPFLPLRKDGVALPEGWERDVENALRRHLTNAMKG